MKAVWNELTIAESVKTEIVEGNIYFPIESVNKEYLQDSNLQTTCVWKGIASYYNLKSGNDTLDNGAWYYANPSKEALRIKDYIAFDRKVKIQ